VIKTACVDRSTSSAIFRFTSATSALPGRLVRVPPRPGTADGS
jgi:hypothetical protein